MDMFARLDQDAERQDQGVDVPLFYLDGSEIVGHDGEQATITVVAAGSKRVRAVRQSNLQRIINRRKRSTPKQLAEGTTREVCAAVLSWTLPDKDGGPWPFSPENVDDLFTTYPFLQEQVEEGMNSHADFFDKPSTS